MNDPHGVSPCPLTKIIATVGAPGSPGARPEGIRRLVESGASLFRLNFSHGSLDRHREMLEIIRTVEQDSDRPLAVLGDLSGPKIRVGPVDDPNGVEVEAGEDVLFLRDNSIAIRRDVQRAGGAADPGAARRFTSTYSGLVDDVEPGHRLLINDGAVRMLVVEKAEEFITARVTVGGLITTGKGINLPNSTLSVESITDKDWRCLEWAIEHELDMVAMSFVRRGDEIRAIKARIEQLMRGPGNRRLPVIAKIEKPEAVANIEDILDAADAVMVARGDLGVEMDLAEVPVIQKRLIGLAGRYGRPCIVATQMLESMIDSPTPTRAEASDVANAIFDGADAVMLSGETAIGKYPGVAVETMARIAYTTETYLGAQSSPTVRVPERLARQGHWTVALAHGARTIAGDVGAQLIATYSKTGVTALHLSQYRFHVPILCFSDDRGALRRMNLLLGVIPVFINEPADLDEFTEQVDRCAIERRLAEPGAPIIMIAGHPIGAAGSTNSLAVHHVGDPTTGYRGH